MRQAVEAIEDLNMRGKVQLIISGGIRTGADVAKALAMGADAVAIGQGVLDGARLQQRNATCSADKHVSARRGLRRARHGAGLLPSLPHRPLSRWASPRRTRCSSSAWTRESARSDCANYLKTLNMELTTIARACGKQDVHHLEREDLVALTVEAAAMANLPLAGTSWVPGK